MPKTMDRSEAIRMIAEDDLAKLTDAERAEQIQIMVHEDWESSPSWSTLPEALRQEFDCDSNIADPSSSRFDPVLMIWLEDKYLGARNAYLCDLVRALRPDVEDVTGTPVEFLACPCCGYRTLEERGGYEICAVCWWEDDGQDNKRASEAWGGPNGGVSLTRARFNFLTYGIYDPAREDLRRLQEPTEKFAKGREFVLDASSESVVEPAAGWRAAVTDE